MFKHFRNNMLAKNEDYVLTKEDIEAFKANQAKSYKEHKKLINLGYYLSSK